MDDDKIVSFLSFVSRHPPSSLTSFLMLLLPILLFIKFFTEETDQVELWNKLNTQKLFYGVLYLFFRCGGKKR